MFNSQTGYVYDVKPIYEIADAKGQALRYVQELLYAGQNCLLTGITPFPYDWNDVPFQLGNGADVPGIMTNPNVNTHFVLKASYVPFVHGMTGETLATGTVVFWMERQNPVYIPPFVARDAKIPNKDLLRERGFIPSFQSPIPTMSWQEAVSLGLITTGTTVLVVTVISDATVIGIVDDIFTVPGGMILIQLGNWLAPSLQPSGALGTVGAR